MYLSSISVIAQIEHDIIRPSVNADQFSLAVKAETALSKGQLSLNIPLMELKGKGYDLPISLIFYNGDVTFCTEASSVGLGWALMAGGVITKTVKGADDNYNDNEHHNNADYIPNRFSDWRNHRCFVNDIRMDPMPDEYTYSLPGHSGTIDISVDGSTINRKLYPDESYKIETTKNGFCITADDGTKFYFEDVERQTVVSYYESTSWFLSRIVTTTGGMFSFNYADEEYVDFSTEDDDGYFEKFQTKRITSIVSDFGTIVFYSTERGDRGGWKNRPITKGNESRKINKIELRDENNNFVKGYELDNSDYFTYSFAPDRLFWTDRRHKLSSITQYDATGNKLPPYEFDYSYKFAKSRLAEIPTYSNSNEGAYLARNSWTSYVGPQAYVDLELSGKPSCHMMYPNTPYTYLVGLTIKMENFAPTADDFFGLERVYYPNGAIEEFIYEDHKYSKVNWTNKPAFRANKIHGKRLAARVRYGGELQQRTEYVYLLHDSAYNAVGPSSGVMTNPSIHCATYYMLESDEFGNKKYVASRVTSEKALNSFMGPPVCYTEVEEIEKDMKGNILNRTIHYFEPKRVSPPVNYIFMYSHTRAFESRLIEIGNQIYGTKTGYEGYMSPYNYENMTYMAYPVGEFYNVVFVADQPLKEVFIGEDGNVRSISEYSYSMGEDVPKYGYKVISKDFYNTSSSNADYTISWISKSEYITKRFRLRGINTIRYYYNENACDSICEDYYVNYNKGRVKFTSYIRGNDKKTTEYYFPGDIINILGNNTSPELRAINGLIEKNIIANPIKTVIKRNNIIIGGECKDYQMHSDVPLLKSVYKIKNVGRNINSAPTINGNEIDYRAELYKEGEILTYDEYHNPEHIRVNETQDKIYVWGYDGRFLVAIIDNMDYATYNASANLKTMLRNLAEYRRIESVEDCVNLRNANQAIRHLLPEAAHITTYTYDPYFGITSEIDDSNLGTIYTYDSFGRLSAKYDAYYKKIEEYSYNLYLQ